MDNEKWMRCAIEEAKKALCENEIPIGAIIVRNEEIIGRGHNTRLINTSPLEHAELNAIKEAAKTLNNWRFDDCTLYVTLEPCVMCSGAIVQCRIKQVVYGASDPKAGGANSLYAILSDPRMYHKCKVISGVLKTECAALLTNFFLERRERKRMQKAKNKGQDSPVLSESNNGGEGGI